jgi:methyltransferase (TIGR00027 family)
MFSFCDIVRKSVGSVHDVISQTALMAAAARAAHRLVDRPPFLLDDPVAARLLGSRAGELIDYHRLHGTHPILSAARAQVTARARFTEECLAAAGVDQYVLLGAGLDSFAHRSPLARSVRVFEADQPETQEYKKSVAPDGPVNYVPVDFETDEPLDRLAAAGFDPARRALVGWLGVTVYLDLPAIERVLAVLGTLASGTELVADHILPRGDRDEAGEAYAVAIGSAIESRGEPWRSCLSTADMADLLARHGFGKIRVVTQRESVDASMWERADTLAPIRLSVLAHAVVA